MERGTNKAYAGLKTCIWTYFWLLMFEGAIRKWIFPGLSNALILVKDPVVIIAYLFALKSGRFPRGGWVTCSILLGIVTFGTAIITAGMRLNQGNVPVAMYGYRTNFLYLPFLFLIAETLDWNDLKKFGKWMLILSLPMAILVFLQFKTSPESFWNVGVAKSMGGQMDAGLGKTRASGLFAFNTGLASYLAMAAAFVIHHFLQGNIHAKVLAALSLIAVAGSTALSASRGITLSVVLVAVVGALCVLIQPKLAKRGIWLSGGMLLLGLVFALSRTFNEGVFVLSTRFEAADGFKAGILDRTLSSFTSVFSLVTEAKFFGQGLGVGTNAGSAMLSVGERTFLVAEEEWQRVVGEVGPVLGLAFIALRVGMAVSLFGKALSSLRQGDSLAMLLFGSCVMLLLNGQLGTAQTLGFVVFAGGLTLAAAKRWDEPQTGPSLADLEAAPRNVIRGRSAYAERLHSGKGT